MKGSLAPPWKDFAEEVARLSLISRRPVAVEKRWCRLRKEE
jgi:hypothetical protein